jgi:hypothetical protein
MTVLECCVLWYLYKLTSCISLMCTTLLITAVNGKIVVIVYCLCRVPVNCKLEHKCLKLCRENCGDCRTIVPRTLRCGHSLNLSCYIDIETYKCTEQVEAELPDCGHKVKKPCHMGVEKYKCTEQVEAELPICGHKVKKPCHVGIRRIRCSHPCGYRLPCGHSCVLECHVEYDPDHLEVSFILNKFFSKNTECMIIVKNNCACVLLPAHALLFGSLFSSCVTCWSLTRGPSRL